MEPPKSLPGKSYRRSHGLKLIVVCCLVVLMAIPAMFISYISFERSNRADEVTQEVSKRYGGAQFVTGPILVTPYIVKNIKGEIEQAGDYVIFPEDGQATMQDITTTLRKRSLFKVPTYQATAELRSVFNPVDTSQNKDGKTLIWDQARILVGVSDGRGLTEDVFLQQTGKSPVKFEPTSYAGRADLSVINESVLHKEFRRHHGFTGRTDMTFLSVPAEGILSEDTDFSVTTNIKIGGATRLGVFPFAKSTRFNVSSDWPTPGFEGGFAPVEREINKDGFTARWSVPYLARGILGEGAAQDLSLFDVRQKAMVVRLVADVSPYQTVNRALKYSVLFIGLVFIAYFLFEVLVGVRVHPAQYILIGLAQSIFYLLLLAFSEHIGFAAAFIIAALATIGITAGYAGAVFGDKKYIARAGAVFALVYGLLYTLMRLQDFALMIGALASFMAIALTMYLTRHMDWYGTKSES